MKTRFWVVLGIVVIALALGSPAKADTLRITCTAPTVCTAGAVTQLSNTNAPTFDLTNTGGATSGTAFIAVLVPNGTASFTVKIGTTTITLEESKAFTTGSLGDSGVLNEPSMNDFTFGGLQSASAQVGVTATSFTVYEFNLGAYSSAGGGAAGISGISITALPAGTVIVAWVEDGSGNVINQTPLSGALTVPEPGSLTLVGSGLLGIAGVIRRRLRR